MDETIIRTFNCIAETLNLTHAAELLGFPLQTVAKRIKRLEDELGYLLLRRKSMGVSLTPEGEVFYEKSKLLQVLYDEIKNRQSTLSCGEKRKLTVIALASAFMLDFILPSIEEILQVLPDTTLKLVFDNKRFLDFKKFEEGICLGIVSGKPKNETDYIFKELCGYTVYPYASIRYFEKYGYPQTFDELKQHRFIGYDFSSVFEFIEHKKINSLAYSVFENPREKVHVWTDDALGCKALIQAHYGIGMLPRYLVDNSTMRCLSEHLIPEQAENLRLFACYPVAFKGNPLIHAFLSFLNAKIESRSELWRVQNHCFTPH